jgi:hypothetical protein
MMVSRALLHVVIPAKAGIQGPHMLQLKRRWIPAFAGMTMWLDAGEASEA